jgi:hypothetical protein
MPALAGFVAKHYGIQHIVDLAMGGLVIGLIVALSLRETAPCRVGKSEQSLALKTS